MVEADDENSLYEEDYLQHQVLGEHPGQEGERRQVRRNSEQDQEDHQTDHSQSRQGSGGGQEASQETDEGEEITGYDVFLPEHLASPSQVQSGE